MVRHFHVTQNALIHVLTLKYVDKMKILKSRYSELALVLKLLWDGMFSTEK